VPFIKRARQWLGPVAGSVRIVAIDQRGTGGQALNCPALQKAMGASDLTPPPAAAVRGCAQRIGDERRFFSTADTVADLEALRRALRVRRIALDGVSYGTYVAQRYALAHPRRVSRLVLDSVVPADGLSMLSIVPIQATERVLGKQTAADLAKVVREQRNGPEMLDMLTGLSVGAPRGNGAANALRAAAEGNTGPLDALYAGVRQVMGSWTAQMLSQGLHASTLCADMPAPWGDASAPLAGRREALERAAAKLSEDDLYPYDRETATGNGIAQQCLHWPPVPLPVLDAARDLPPVPVLLLAGELDLSTPLEWARRAAARAPRGRLLIVEDNGHGVQGQGDAETLDAVREFIAALAR
jgi:pimeloyl-ACP methyl ester carboxylesterase